MIMVVGRKVFMTGIALNLNATLGLDRGRYHFVLRGQSGIWVGDSTVANSDGFPVPTASDLHLDLLQGDELYAYGATGQELTVLAYEV
jgi:hypothetical protein